MVGDLVVAQVNLSDIDGVFFEGLAKHDQLLVVDSVRKVVLVIALDDELDRLILIVGFFQVSAKRFVSFQVCLLAVVAVLAEQLRLDEVSVGDLLVSVLLIFFFVVMAGVLLLQFVLRDELLLLFVL